MVRFATASVGGKPLDSIKGNVSRAALLLKVSAAIKEKRWKQKVLLFPGGYFFIKEHLGPLEHQQRSAILDKKNFSKACVKAASQLSCLVVAGVDGAEWKHLDWKTPNQEYPFSGDQLCVSWNRKGVTGIGRKVFPVRGEAGRYVVYSGDYMEWNRLVSTGKNDPDQVLLCSCYDMFGVQEHEALLRKRKREVAFLRDGSDDVWFVNEDRSTFREVVATYFQCWGGLVENSSMAATAIHHFTTSGPGSGKVYWERHGILKASEYVPGKIAFGAAHFEPPLPKKADKARFAAYDGEYLDPVDHIYIGNPVEEGSVLVRLFEVAD